MSNMGTIIDDLTLEESRMDATRVETIKRREIITTAKLIIIQLMAENARLEAENAELRHHLNPAPDGPLTEAEAPY